MGTKVEETKPTQAQNTSRAVEERAASKPTWRLALAGDLKHAGGRWPCGSASEKAKTWEAFRPAH